MNYLRRLVNSDLGQAFLKSCLVMSCAWGIIALIHFLLSLLFITPTIWFCLFLATIVWGTHVNYTWGWTMEQDDTSLRLVFKPEESEDE